MANSKISNITWNNTTYDLRDDSVPSESKTASSGGTDLSLVTTGEKYTWNSKTSNTGTVTSVTISATSPISIDSSSAITTNGSRTISHDTSGATAGSYGDSANQTPSYGSTFKVPYITVNSTGHVTAISEHTVKIPASDNTDSKVKEYNTTSSNNYRVLFSYYSDDDEDTTYVRKSGSLLFNPSTGILTSPSFNATSALESKENISDTTLDAVKLINDTKIVNFTFKNDGEHTPKIGFIADYTDSLLATPKHDTMDLYNCIGVLMKAVQELSKEVEELKRRK